jgi:hypothetical protein
MKETRYSLAYAENGELYCDDDDDEWAQWSLKWNSL